MRPIIGLLGIALVIHLVLAGIILGEGFLIHWLFRSLDVGMSVLVAAGTTITSIIFFFQMARAFVTMPPSLRAALDESEDETGDDEDDEDDDEEDEDDEPESPSPRHGSSPLDRPRDRRRHRRR
jgi:hypothetical protein